MPRLRIPRAIPCSVGTALLAGLPLFTANAMAQRHPVAVRSSPMFEAPGMIEAWIDNRGREHFAPAGVVNLASRSQIDRRTVFHMASVTKPFVATAILQLAERGRIDLDAPPTRYLPYLRIDDPRGGVIAKASGMPFETYMRRHVLAPLGMRHSSLLLADTDPRRLAAPHMPEGGRVAVHPVFPYNRVHAGSSTLYADAADMLRWARYWGRPDARLLSRESVAAMLRPAIAIDGPDRAQWQPTMGLGWFLLTVEGRNIAFHMGQDVGFTTGMMVEPGTGRAVVAMSNIATEAESERLFDLCLRRMIAMQAPPPATRPGPYTGA